VPESIRDLVVSLSLNAGNFKKTATDINNQIKNVESEFNALGGKVDGFAQTLEGRNEKIQNLNDKLKLQTDAVKNYEDALKAAQDALANATEAGQLAAAKKVSDAETKLNNAKADVKVTVDEIARLSRELNGLKLTNLGSTLSTMGKQMQTFGRRFSMYVGAPLAALGVKSYNLAADYENAMAQIQVATGGTEDEMLTLEEQMLGMTERLPISFTELATLMTTLAQANVPMDQLAQVAEVMVGLDNVTDVGAAESAKGVIQFLTVLGEGYGNIENMASALAVLGTNSVSTGSDIFEMAQRMVATGSVAGMSAVDILSLATGFSSLGINAEAGGSAASKLMKAMSLAAATGEGFYNVIKDDQVVSIGFGEAMGLSMEQFKAAWAKSPADTMLSFFQSLQNAGETGQGAIIGLLDAMGITEIRMSNLVLAAAKNPALFGELLTMGQEAWDENAALAEKTAIAYDTTTNQGVINMNKIENAGADVGENVKDAVQPIIDTVTNLVSEFGKLDEDTQSRWVKVAGALVLLGPAALGIGKVVSSVGSLIGFIGKVKAGDAENFTKLINVLSGPIGIGIGAAAGTLAILTAIENIQSPVETITANLKNIVIEIDETSYNNTLDAMAKIKAQSDALAGKTGEHNKNISAAVKAGYGTDDMYGTALGYEAMLTQQTISEIAGKYAEKYDELNGAIGAAKDDADRQKIAAERDAWKASWDAEVAAAKANYMEQVNALVTGMTAGQPEAQAALEQASKDYDLLALVNQAIQKAGDNEADPIWKEVFTQDVLDRFFGGQQFENIVPNLLVLTLEEKLVKGLEGGLKTIGGKDSFMFTLLQSILGDPLTADLFDQTKTTGILDGLVEILDWKSAGEKSGANYGESLTPGLADAITGASAAGKDAMASLGKELSLAAATQGSLAAAAYAAAFKSGLGGSSGYSGGSGSTGSRGSGASYSATSNLNGNVIIQGGVDARTLARLLANENMRQLRGSGVRS
jgi:TP901 family phage tail tape measure protein